MRNKIIILLVVILSFFSLICQTFRYSNASPSLILREEPNKDSKKVINIPIAQKVKIIEESSKNEEINGKKGTWVKINWKTYTGWVFDAYLVSDFSISSLKLKDIFEYKISEIGDFFFNGYYIKDNKKEYFANFHVQSSDKIYSSYEAGGAESTIINFKYTDDSLILTVKYEELADDYLENDNPATIKTELYDCIIIKQDFIKYINDKSSYEVKCNKK